MTYARRYGYSALLCASSEEDDDAQEAEKAHPKFQDAKPEPPPKAEVKAALDKVEAEMRLKRIHDGFMVLGITNEKMTDAEQKTAKGKCVRGWGLSFENLDAIEARINEEVNKRA